MNESKKKLHRLDFLSQRILSFEALLFIKRLETFVWSQENEFVFKIIGTKVESTVRIEIVPSFLQEISYFCVAPFLLYCEEREYRTCTLLLLFVSPFGFVGHGRKSSRKSRLDDQGWKLWYYTRTPCY